MSDEEENWEQIDFDETDPIINDILQNSNPEYLEIEIASILNEDIRHDNDEAANTSSNVKNENKADKARKTRLKTWITSLIYKTSILCELTLGRMYNVLCNLKEIRAFLLSLIPHSLNRLLESRQNDIDEIMPKLLSWWRMICGSRTDILAFIDYWTIMDTHSTSLDVLKDIKTPEHFTLLTTMLFVSLCRTLGHKVRFIFSLTSFEEIFPKEKSLYKKSSNIKAKNIKKETINDHSGRFWLEVFNRNTNTWLSLDCFRFLINDPLKLEDSNCPFSFVMSYDERGRIKDVSRRYANSCSLRAVRVSKYIKWMEHILGAFNSYLPMTTPHEADHVEDEEFTQRERNEMTPSNINQYKNHPLFAIERFCKKFQVIYPKSPIIGWIKNEPIYPHSCLQQVRSAEAWLQQGKTIKENEAPAKIVKSNQRHASGDESSNRQHHGHGHETPLYGAWQVENYKPPITINGMIPKNSFNNIDLYHPRMLPYGCVHLTWNSAKHLAKSLNIDYAEAVVGFDFSGGKARPRIDGIVVCAEYEPVLKEAYDQMCQIEEASRLGAKRELVKKRWQSIIKKALILKDFNVKYEQKLKIEESN